ncbi:MAG TPA: hypothetical protein VGJ04_09625 [Pirellulales bacterium]
MENTYFIYAIQAYDAHLVPYSADVPVEYPPLAWWIIYTPRFLNSQHITQTSEIQPALRAYAVIFRGFMFSCDLASAVLLTLIVRRRNPELLGWAMLTYTICTAILAHLLYDRLDIALLALMMGWGYCWLRAKENSSPAFVWSTAAYAVLGLSISFKLIPIICVPFLVLSDWRTQQKVKRLSAGMVALVLTIGLPFLIQYAISGPGVFAFLKYHGERGIQIESLYSTLMMIGSLFGRPVFVVESHSAFDLEGSLAKLMTALSNVLMYGFLAGTWLWAFFRRSAYGHEDAYRAACFVMVGALICSKVLSPQYFIWAIPLALLLAVDTLPARSATPWLLAALLIIFAGLTTWLFPYHYTNMPDHTGLLPIGSPDSSVLQPLPCIVLGLRNVLYLGIVILLGLLLYRKVDRIEGVKG